MSRSTIISLCGGTIGYAGRPVLTEVDFEVGRGEVVALLGPNGSGKSTLIRALVGLLPLSAGTLTLAGSKRRRRPVGYVPQRHSVGGGVPATVEEVVASGRLVLRRLLPPLLPALDRGVVCDAIATVGLTEKIGQPVSALSGGQQRRVLIARALAGEPEVLIMDEPFAGVDRANQEILAGTLAALVRNGVTLIVVTHEIAPIAALVDRTVVLQDGRVAYSGPPTTRVLATYGGHDPDPHGTPGSPAAETAPGGGTPGTGLAGPDIAG